MVWGWVCLGLVILVCVASLLASLIVARRDDEIQQRIEAEWQDKECS